MKIPFNFLPIDKIPGMTSHDVVAKVRRALRDVVPRGTRVGHTGTLDPFASGLLIVAIGKATRFSDDVHRYPKTYEAELTLGTETTTLDPEGEISGSRPVPSLSQMDLDRCCTQFTGVQEQLPPSYSAKLVDGIRSYELARKNRAVDLKPCSIEISAIDLKIIDSKSLFCRVTCSTGTYIRSLGRDIARELGTVGHVSKLRRTSVGPIKVEQALGAYDTELDPVVIDRYVIPVSEVLPEYPEVELPIRFREPLLQGRQIEDIDLPHERFLGVIREGTEVSTIFKCEYQARTRQLRTKMLCFKS